MANGLMITMMVVVMWNGCRLRNYCLRLAETIFWKLAGVRLAPAHKVHAVEVGEDLRSMPISCKVNKVKDK